MTLLPEPEVERVSRTIGAERADVARWIDNLRWLGYTASEAAAIITRLAATFPRSFPYDDGERT